MRRRDGGIEIDRSLEMLDGGGDLAGRSLRPQASGSNAAASSSGICGGVKLVSDSAVLLSLPRANV
jgi:hypothetical protein